MKSLKFCLLVVLITVGETVSLLDDGSMFERPTSAFNSFSEEYHKTYTSANQLKFRQKVFNKNIDVVGALNENPNNTYPQGITYYSDLTPDEFKHLVLNKKLAKTPEVLIDITKWNNSISTQVNQKQPSLDEIICQQQINNSEQQYKEENNQEKLTKQQIYKTKKEKKQADKSFSKLQEFEKKKIQKNQKQEMKKSKDNQQNLKKQEDQNLAKLKKPYGQKLSKSKSKQKLQTKRKIVVAKQFPINSQYGVEKNEIKQQEGDTLISTQNSVQNTPKNNIQGSEEKWIAPQGALPQIDWKTQGKVSHVKMQGICGNCYSFSTTGALEGAYMIKHNVSKVSYSDQQITDCCGVKGYGCNGCEGGWQWQALRYILNHGIVTEDEYKTESSESGQIGQCKKIFSPNKILNQKSPFSAIQSGNVDMLYRMVSKQPVSVGVDSQNMQFVLSGDTTALFTNCSSKPEDANHAMLIVGYDTDGNWILKNSWSSHWGDNGYIKLKAGNTCGVANFALHPNVI